MKESFIECTDAIWQCLSIHDVIALHAIYAGRVAIAEQAHAGHVKGTHDGLIERERLLGQIYESLEAELHDRHR